MRWVVALLIVSGCDVMWRIDRLPPLDVDTTLGSPQLVVAVGTTGMTETTLPVSIDSPNNSGRLLLVAITMSADQGHTNPTVGTVVYGSTDLTAIDAINGVPGSPGTRTELWQLIAPPAGSNNVVVSLVTAAIRVHVDAYMFIGVNQSTPVRSTMHASGRATSASLSLLSADGDLVFSTVGDGNMIVDVAAPQTVRWLSNDDSGYTLDNSAGSVGPGASPGTAVAWNFAIASPDNWQLIVASLEP